MKKTVAIKCRGWGFNDEEVLSEPIYVDIEIRRAPFSSIVSATPRRCPYNTGGHGRRCKAAHPDQDKVGNGVICHFSFDYPYSKDVPAELKEAVRELYRIPNAQNNS